MISLAAGHRLVPGCETKWDARSSEAMFGFVQPSKGAHPFAEVLWMGGGEGRWVGEGGGWPTLVTPTGMEGESLLYI